MNLPQVLFTIDYPLRILDNEKRVCLYLDEERAHLFSRNLYSNLFSYCENPFLRPRYPDFVKGGEIILDYLSKKRPLATPLNVSLFGSGLFSNAPEDFDYLVITDGNEFLVDEMEFKTNDKRIIKSGISIKGLKHFQEGYKGPKSKNQNVKLEQIVNRTAVSLYRRHLPVWGYDFVDNENVFLDNIHAQVSDLISNTFNIFYSNDSNRQLEVSERSRKILSRVYQAATFLERKTDNPEVSFMRKQAYEAISNKNDLQKSKNLFEKFVELYMKKFTSDKNLNHDGGNLND